MIQNFFQPRGQSEVSQKILLDDLFTGIISLKISQKDTQIIYNYMYVQEYIESSTKYNMQTLFIEFIKYFKTR